MRRETRASYRCGEQGNGEDMYSNTGRKRPRWRREEVYATRTRRGNKIRAGEREEESARIHVLVRAGEGRREHAETKRERGRGRINSFPL